METSASGSKSVWAKSSTPHMMARRPSLSRTAQWRLYKLSLLVSDGLMLAFAFRFAFHIRFERAIPIFEATAIDSPSFYQALGLSLIPIWLLIFVLTGLYGRRNLLGGTQEYALVFRAITVGMLLVVVTGFMEPFFIFARGWLVIAWVLAFLGVVAGRFVLRRLVYRARQHGYFLSQALIIGANDEGKLLAEQLAGWRTSGLHVIGFIDDEGATGAEETLHLSVLGPISELPSIIRREGIEELIVAASALSREKMLEIFTQYGLMSGLTLRLSSGLYEIITTGLHVKEVGYVPLVCVNKVRLAGADRLMKLLLDYCLTIPGLIIISPLMLLVALAVKLDSPGPIIHRRRVMGVNGTQFDAFKFRTMHVNGDELLRASPELMEELARTHKLKHDPRITRLGHLLRKTSLDELPQLFNVLKREMSLVGPRMISPPEMEMYGRLGMNLLTVEPGISGLWQVSGRSNLSYDERVQMDMYYIRNWTIWLDLQILFQTIPAVLQKRGAY